MSADLLKLNDANMDIDPTTPKGQIEWQQQTCPWIEADGKVEHKCVIKNVSVCPYFCGIEYLDKLICCYPNENPYASNE